MFVAVLFMRGGADTYNVLVPHSNCHSSDMYEDYATVRSILALNKDDLLPIEVQNSTQPCSTFGLHPKLPFLQQLWQQGDAAAIANVGAMVEPIADRAEYESGSKRVPDGMFSHNMMQRNAATLHAQLASAKGVRTLV